MASGILIEAYSVEDDGAGICFNVFIYNSQPGIGIDYVTGDSWLVENEIDVEVRNTTIYTEDTIKKYVLNTNTKKFHFSTCESVTEMKDKNKKEVEGNIYFPEYEDEFYTYDEVEYDEFTVKYMRRK